MPIAYEIDEGLGIFVAKASGHVTSQDVHDLFAAMVSDVRFRAGFSHLYDLRYVRRMEIAAESVREEILSCAAARTMVALVYESQLLGRWVQGFERFASLGMFTFRSFPQINSARLWLVGGETAG